MWDLTGKQVICNYVDTFEVSGVVRESRIGYGGVVHHYVNLDVPVEVFGSERHSVVVEASQILDIQ